MVNVYRFGYNWDAERIQSGTRVFYMFSISATPNIHLAGRHRHAFTLIELLVVIAIVCLLAAILFPVFSRVRNNARRSACQSNLKQLGLGMRQYNDDYDGLLMPSFLGPNTTFNNFGNVSWPVMLQPYVKSEQVFVCPSAAPTMDWGLDASTFDACWGSTGIINKATALPRVCYGVNITIHHTTATGNFLKEATLTEPSLTASAMDSVWIDGDFAHRLRFARAGFPRHFDGVNVLYEDAHVKWINAGQLESLRFAP